MPLFTKGYDEVNDRVSKGSKFTMSCYNCQFYYQTEEDTEEMCQNPEVLEYDMVMTPTSIYCNRWRPVQHKSTTQFKKGVELNGRKKSILQATRKKSSK